MVFELVLSLAHLSLLEVLSLESVIFAKRDERLERKGCVESPYGDDLSTCSLIYNTQFINIRMRFKANSCATIHVVNAII